MFNSVTEIFQTLKDTKAKYAVLQGYWGIPGNAPKELVILVPKKETLVRILELQPVRPGDETRSLGKHCYTLQWGGKENPQIITIYFLEAGLGYFPNRFESALIENCEYYADMVRIPHAHLRAYAFLYWNLYRAGWLEKNREDRASLEALLGEQVGPKMPNRGPMPVLEAGEEPKAHPFLV